MLALLRSVLHSDRLPAHPLSRALAPLRQQVAADLLARDRVAIEGIGATWRRDRAAARPRLERLVDALIADMRWEVWARARQGSATERTAGALDRLLHQEGRELMDDPSVDPAVRTRIITDLDRVNHLVGSYQRVVDVAGPWLQGAGPVRVLDLASGHGGLPLWLAAEGADLGLALEVTASDLDDAYLAVAREQAVARGLRLRTRLLDALALSLEPGEVDVITCTLALHHFRPGQVAVLLAEAVRVAARGVVFMDGLRSLTQLGGGVGMFTAVGAPRPSVHDAVVSVRRMFATEELALVAACAPGAARSETTYVPPAWTAVRAPGVAS